MKTNTSFIYSELECMVLDDIVKWAINKYGDEMEKHIFSLVEEFWKEKLE